MAKYAHVTTWRVRQIWAAPDLKSHLLKTFKVSNDPHFAEKVIDVVGFYLSPPDNPGKKSQPWGWLLRWWWTCLTSVLNDAAGRARRDNGWALEVCL